jgi:hypothetical protein
VSTSTVRRPEPRYAKTTAVIKDEPVYFDYQTGNFVWGPKVSETSVAMVQRTVENTDIEREERRDAAARERKLKKDAAPIEVSIVLPSSTLQGDYLLRGFHASAHTPLLADERGNPAGFNPTDLRNIKLLRRLSGFEWDEYRRLNQAAIDAYRADRDIGRAPSSLVTRARNQRILVEDSNTRTNIADVEYHLEGIELVAAAHTETVRAASLSELRNAVADLVHPDRGQHTVWANWSDDQILVRPYDPADRRTRMSHLWTPRLDVTEEELRDAHLTRERTNAERTAWIEARLLPR